MDKTHNVIIGWNDKGFVVSETDANSRMTFGPFTKEVAEQVARCCNHAYRIGGDDKLAAIRKMLGVSRA